MIPSPTSESSFTRYRIHLTADCKSVPTGMSMAGRTALLISCTKIEAEEMRAHARAQDRTLSAAVLKVVMRGVDFDDRLSLQFKPRPLPLVPRNRRLKTAVHLRCSVREARRIRAGARRRGATVSGCILHFLRAAWRVEREREAFGKHATILETQTQK
jgi:hypothetical protein